MTTLQQASRSLQPSRLRRTGRVAVALTLAAAAGAAATDGAAQVVTETPAHPEGLIVAGAETTTTRPERRDFTNERMAALQLPPGFEIDVFARDLENPRVMVVGSNGAVYVAEREAARIRLLRDTNGDGRADVSRHVGDELEGVHGLAIRDDRLYMVAVNELHSTPIRSDGGLGEFTLHIDDLPDAGQHPNRTMAWGPDGMLYLTVGSQTNAVPEENEETAAMLRVDPDTWEREVFAEGLRNTIGFGWHPTSSTLYGLDHNSDHRGDDWPPEELNQIVEGGHYGWPFCGGLAEVDWQVAANPEGDMPREQFCAGTETPVLTYTAHAAPMQLVYYTSGTFPDEYRNDAFVTMRGSWNRGSPIGYEVARIRFDDRGTPTDIEPFVAGWLLDDGRAHFGRLMGIAVGSDGSLFVGDDTNGVIYRVSHNGGR